MAGYITSVASDMEGRLHQVTTRLREMGYQPVVTGVGTDFLLLGILPVPRAQPIKVWLWRKPEDGPLNPLRARVDFARVMGEMAFNYNPLLAYVNEVRREVVDPTVDTSKSWLPWILAGVGVIFLLGKVKK